MSDEINEGYYYGNPTVMGLITTRNGFAQLAIEVAIEVPAGKNADGTDKFNIVKMTKFGGLKDQGLTYTMQDAENCGADVTNVDIRTWVTNPTRRVRVHVVMEEYEGKVRPKLKSIFDPNSQQESGFLIQKQAMPTDMAASVAADARGRIQAILAQRGNPAQPSSAPSPAALPKKKTAF